MAGTAEGDAWMTIFYGEGRMDVQLTNQLYNERYGTAGTMPGYTNTVSNPATTGNPASMSPQAYASSAGGTRPPTTTAPTGTTTPSTPRPPTGTTPTGPTGPAAPGTGPGTAPPPTAMSTADLLKEFLESDPDLMLNMIGNHFREGGASNVFMQWFTNNFRSFWGRYLGYVAEQAYNGQVPNLSFVDWVRGMDPTGSFYQQSGINTGAGARSSTFANFANQQGAA